MKVRIERINEAFTKLLAGKSLREFCLKEKVSYTTAKKWRKGVYLIPQEFFDKYLKDKCEVKDVAYYSNNWGRIKGGKKRVNNLTKAEIDREMEERRSLRKKVTYETVEEVKQITDPILEIYGALMGDGCLSLSKKKDGKEEYWIVFSGHKVLDKDYHENYLVPLVKQEFKANLGTLEKKKNLGRETRAKNKRFFIQLAKMGFPIGKKGNRLNIPQKFYKLKWERKKWIVRGIFDTDGCISARKDEHYRYPHIIISSKSKDLLDQIYSMLRSEGYPICRIREKSGRTGEVRLKGIKNTIRWMKDIGSSNKRHLFKYEYWLKTGVIPVKEMGV